MQMDEVRIARASQCYESAAVAQRVGSPRKTADPPNDMDVALKVLRVAVRHELLQQQVNRHLDESRRRHTDVGQVHGLISQRHSKDVRQRRDVGVHNRAWARVGRRLGVRRRHIRPHGHHHALAIHA